MIETKLPFPAVWSYLFPIGTRFRSVGNAQSDGEADAVLILADRVLTSVDLSRASGVVVSNPGRGFKDRMHADGFSYIRVFAASPSVNPRWLIPLDSGAIARGAFQLHAPYRFVPRAKYAIARATAVTLLPFQLTPKIGIAQRADPALEKLIQEQFGSAVIRLAFSTGTPGGFPKPSFAVLSHSGQVLGFGKLGEAPIRRRALENEANALAHFARSEALRHFAPGLIFAGDVDGRFVLLETPLEGSPGPRAFTAWQRRFLDLMPVGRVRRVTSSSFFRSIANRIEEVGGRTQELAIWRRLRDSLDGVELAAVEVHGDFAPWNLRRQPRGLGAFDWEWWSPDGLPFVDEVHHRLQVGFLLEGWGGDRAFAELRTLALSRPLGLELAHVYALIGAGLLDYYLRIIEDGYPEQGSLAVPYGQLLTRMLALLDGLGQR